MCEADAYGFKRSYIRDRWHAGAGHGYFLNNDFCEKFWGPFLETGAVVDSERNPELPAWWVRLLYAIQPRFVLLALLVAMLYSVPWQRLYSRMTAERVRNNGTIHPSSPLPNDLIQARSAADP